MRKLRNFYKATAVGATLATVLLSLTMPSVAQSSGAGATSDNAPGPVEAVVVTGSRIARKGYEAPTPTTVLGSEDIEQVSPKNIGDILLQLPSFSGTQNQATTNQASQQAGGNYVNLRDLGPARTLVLLDGRRITPTAVTETIDTNIIPIGLLDHVDVVTGGASAAWGSGAVAGVVNFVLKSHIDGFKGDIAAGESTYGDSADVRASMAYGTSFANGRGELLLGVDYEHNYGVHTQGSRPWERVQGGVIANPTYTATNGQSKLLSVTNWQWATGTFGGLITSGPAKGTQFLPGGTTSAFQYGSIVSGNYQVGGGGIDPGLIAPLSPPLDRIDAFARATYELSPDITASIDYLHARTGTSNGIARYFNQGGLTIQKTNAYLPTSVATALGATTSFNLGRYSRDWGAIVTDTANTTDHGTFALKGKFGDGWTWNAYDTYGRTIYRLRLLNDTITGNLNLALNSVINPANGQPICASTLTNPTNGCVPLNPFGDGSASAAALSYISGVGGQQTVLTQNALGGGINGDLFSTWAGPVSVAAGFEYRRETLATAVDALSQANAFFIGNPHAANGEYSVVEGYFETVVPLLHDLWFAKELDFNGAVRETNYTGSGAVTAWKLGLTYNVNDDLTFRVTQSRDIRAPNLNELYLPSGLKLPSLNDPANQNQSTTIQEITQGNSKLTPELSDTLTYGVVLTPSWLPGFNFSADVYNITINNAIVTATSQTIVNNCYAGVASQCAFVTRDTSGKLSSVSVVYFNLPRQSTRGIDLESSYQFSLSDLNSDWDGTFGLRALASYVTNLVIAAGYNQAGEVGTGTSPPASGVPHLRADGHATYSNGPLTTDIEVKYIGGGKYSQNNGSLGIDKNDVSSQTIVSLNVQYTIPNDLVNSLQIYGNIHNIFDQDPPFDPYNFSAPNTSNPAIYDLLGRTFTAGVRFKF